MDTRDGYQAQAWGTYRSMADRLADPRVFAGGDGTDDRRQELLDRPVAELSADELQELDGLIVARAGELAEASTDEDLQELQTLATRATEVRTRQDELAAEEEQRVTQREELLSQITPPVAEGEGTGDGEGEGTTTEGEGTTEGTTTDEGAGDGTTSTEGGEGEGSTSSEGEGAPAAPEAVAAAAAAATRRRPAPGRAGGTRTPASNVRTPAAEVAAIVAGGDIPRFSVGQHLTFEQLGEALAEKLHAMGGGRVRTPGRALVASIRTEYPEERRLTGDPARNLELIEAVVAAAQSQSMEALVAAGGLCAPVEARYDLENISDARRPIRDSLVRFGAGRGGIRFIQPPTLADLEPAIGIWTAANDADPNNVGNTGVPAEERLATKPCMTIACGDEVQVVIDAITLCLKVGNFSLRTFPEQFRTFYALALAAHAREAENRLFDKVAANSSTVTDGRNLGAARDVLEVAGRASAQYRSRHRMSEAAVLRAIAPDWVRDLIAADLLRQAPGDATLEVAYADVDRFFRVRNVAMTWSPDAGGQNFGAQAPNGALLPWPGSFEWLLFHEGAHLFLDAGELDLGAEIRDVDSTRTNDVHAFTETFENTAFTGVESLVIESSVCASGVAQAAQTVAICGAGTGGS